jgi:hypothetical protein
MFRVSVLILAGLPLLLPPGMCLCPEGSAPAKVGLQGKIAGHDCCEGCCRLPDSGHRLPSDKPCPPHCPAKADNFKLFEKTKPVVTMAVLTGPGYSLVYLPSCRRLLAPSGPSYPSAPPIYLAVRSLVI